MSAMAAEVVYLQSPVVAWFSDNLLLGSLSLCHSQCSQQGTLAPSCLVLQSYSVAAQNPWSGNGHVLSEFGPCRVCVLFVGLYPVSFP